MDKYELEVTDKNISGRFNAILTASDEYGTMVKIILPNNQTLVVAITPDHIEKPTVYVRLK
jgi:hypothetical protein